MASGGTMPAAMTAAMISSGRVRSASGTQPATAKA